MSVSQGITLILQFVASIVTARYLSPADMGIYASGAAIVGVVSLIQTISLPAMIVRERVLDEHVLRTAFTVNLIISILLSATIAAAGLWARHFVANPGVGTVVLTLAWMPLIGVFSLMPGSLLEREARFRELAIIGTVTSALTAVLTVLFAIQDFRYLSIVYAVLIATLVGAVLLIIAYRQAPTTRLGLRHWRQVGHFGLQMAAVSGINSLNSKLSDIVIAKFQGLPALGFYNRAANLNNMVWSSITSIAARLILVDFATLLRRDESLRLRYIEISSLMTSVLWPAFAGLAVLSPFVIELLYGAKWLFAASPLSLLCISSAVQVSVTMTWELFTVRGELSRQTRLEAARFAVAIVAFTIGCLISLQAAAFARVVDSVFAVWLYWPHVLRMTDTKAGDYLAIYVPSFVATLAAIAPAALLRFADPDPSQFALAGAVVAGIALWIGAAVAMRMPVARRGEELLVSLRTRLA